MRPTRTEKFQIDLRLNKAQTNKYIDQLKTLPMAVPSDMQEGDSLTVRYTLGIEYFGRVVDCLTAIETMLDDPGVVWKVNTQELNFGKCLIQDVLSKINRIERKL